MTQVTEMMNKRLALEKKLDESGIPDYMQESVLRYIMDGVPVGHFLTALFSNDLKGVFDHADDRNAAHVKDYVHFLYNNAPVGCWGSRENYRSWINHRGLQFSIPKVKE